MVIDRWCSDARYPDRWFSCVAEECWRIEQAANGGVVEQSPRCASTSLRRMECAVLSIRLSSALRSRSERKRQRRRRARRTFASERVWVWHGAHVTMVCNRQTSVQQKSVHQSVHISNRRLPSLTSRPCAPHDLIGLMLKCTARESSRRVNIAFSEDAARSRTGDHVASSL